MGCLCSSRGDILLLGICHVSATKRCSSSARYKRTSLPFHGSKGSVRPTPGTFCDAEDYTDWFHANGINTDLITNCGTVPSLARAGHGQNDNINRLRHSRGIKSSDLHCVGNNFTSASLIFILISGANLLTHVCVTHRNPASSWTWKN